MDKKVLSYLTTAENSVTAKSLSAMFPLPLGVSQNNVSRWLAEKANDGLLVRYDMGKKCASEYRLKEYVEARKAKIDKEKKLKENKEDVANDLIVILDELIEAFKKCQEQIRSLL